MKQEFTHKAYFKARPIECVNITRKDRENTREFLADKWQLPVEHITFRKIYND